MILDGRGPRILMVEVGLFEWTQLEPRLALVNIDVAITRNDRS